MFWMCIIIAYSNTYPQHMIYGEISKFFSFYHFDSDPRYTPFLLYVRWKSGVTFVRRCFRDVRADIDFKSKIRQVKKTESYCYGI